MSKTKKIIFWVFVSLICAAGIAAIVYESMPHESNAIENVIEVTDTAAVDTITIADIDTIA